MREKVRAFMEQYHMVTAGERVLLGLSGGADSVCLFHLLRELQEPLGFSLLAGHGKHSDVPVQWLFAAGCPRQP